MNNRYTSEKRLEIEFYRWFRAQTGHEITITRRVGMRDSSFRLSETICLIYKNLPVNVKINRLATFKDYQVAYLKGKS